VCGAPVIVSREVLRRQRAQGIVVNSGCSNVATGEAGLEDARRMCALAAEKMGVLAESLFVASTGVIGRRLPMGHITPALASIELSPDGGKHFSRAIMTTDTVPKVRAVRFHFDGIDYTLAGTAKGSGMTSPNMATVFCFLTTDAQLDATWLQTELKAVADESINMVDVDLDTSTSDMMLVLANGAAGGPCLSEIPAARALAQRALRAVCIELAQDLARDGEGAKTLIEVEVRGATTLRDARLAAKTVVGSPLVKTMITGRDPNLGRVLMALGRSGAELVLERLSVWINQHLAFEQGQATALEYGRISQEMDAERVRLVADLGLGEHSATAWGCDLTEDYVRINADYTT
jgi:glutamate N-acetyltransferase/amino-acid N-acetyltransferase